MDKVKYIPRPPAPIDLEQFKQLVIDRGIKSAKAKETGARLEGALEGFAIARKLENLEQFDRAIKQRYLIEQTLRHDCLETEVEFPFCLKKDSSSAENYWRYRYATLQLEYVAGILRVFCKRPEKKSVYQSATRQLLMLEFKKTK